MLECSLVTKFGSTLERGEDGVTCWELGNSMLRDIKGSTLKEVELVSTFWEGGLRLLEAGDIMGIWAIGKKITLRRSDRVG